MAKNRLTEERKTPSLILEKPNYGYANEVEPKLRACKKFTLDDREIFARNLGRLIADIQMKHEVKLSRLFSEAFGNSAESLYKKRKSIVALPGEEVTPNKLRSQARDYLVMLFALIPYSRASSDDDQICRALLILRFIEDSSYDSKMAIRDKMSAEFRREIKIQFDKLSTKIQRAVPIDYMYEWSRNHMPRKGLGLECVSHSIAAPSVRIAEVFTPISKDIPVLNLKVDFSSVSEQSDKEISFAIQKALFAAYNGKLELHGEWDLSRQLEDFFDENADSVLQGEEFIWSTAPVCYCFRTYVDLDLRFSSLENKWSPYLLWTTSLLPDCLSDSYEEAIVGPYPLHEKRIPICWSEDTLELLYADCDNFESGEVKLFWCNLFDFPPFDRFRGTDNLGSLTLDGVIEDLYCCSKEEQDEFLFNTSRDDIHSFDYLLNNYYSMYDVGHVPAPSDSFAKAILENLAYAPPEQRIDTLMINDAKTKFASFKKLVDLKETEYKTAIESFN
jgi:hypothetical protein